VCSEPRCSPQAQASARACSVQRRPQAAVRKTRCRFWVQAQPARVWARRWAARRCPKGAELQSAHPAGSPARRRVADSLVRPGSLVRPAQPSGAGGSARVRLVRTQRALPAPRPKQATESDTNERFELGANDLYGGCRTNYSTLSSPGAERGRFVHAFCAVIREIERLAHRVRAPLRARQRRVSCPRGQRAPRRCRVPVTRSSRSVRLAPRSLEISARDYCAGSES
jgi:hypothetical protein